MMITNGDSSQILGLIVLRQFCSLKRHSLLFLMPVDSSFSVVQVLGLPIITQKLRSPGAKEEVTVAFMSKMTSLF